ncbi:MAG: sodium-dependent transporter [Alphaproteobacteria bacterium]|nr:sodium-dependent transporter [Alphaproteobacteria bacterium]
MQHKNTSFWTSNMGFTLACVGAAVGLGNIWKFPYMTGTQGGGAFVFVYLITIFAIAIPVAAAELLVGRKGQSDAVSSVRDIAVENKRPAGFGIIGGIGVFGSFILLTFYAVIAGWVSSYIWRALSGQIGSLDATSAGAMFTDLLASPNEMIVHQLAFLVFLGLILIRKLSAGLERANLILMPSLVVMLAFIAVYGAVAGDIKASLAYMFTPDFSKITPEVIQSAVGQGFFSVGVGAAMLMTYGAYLDKSINLGRAAIIIALADTAIAILAGIGIFAIVFGQSLDPTAGPGLIFTTLPLAFAQMPFGGPLALIFFMLVYFAALTSGLSLAEVMFRWAENRFGWSRKRAIYVMLGATFLVGLSTVFSFNIWSDVKLVGRTMFDLKDYLVTAYIMPIGGLGVILFAAWVMPVETLKQAFGGDGFLFSAWLFAGRFLAPLGISWIFWAGL